jgi:hypothetical protein
VYNIVKDKLPGENAMVVDFNLYLTGFIGSNTAVYHLGNVVQSNSALFYITPYMSKSKTPPGRVLSVLVKVLEDIHSGGLRSCHPDVMNGDERPQVKDLPLKNQMQRAVARFLNKITAITEHHETKMAMCLLGTKSHWSTESFCYFNVKTLLPYLKHCNEHGLQINIDLNDNEDYSDVDDIQDDDQGNEDSTGLDLGIDEPDNDELNDDAEDVDVDVDEREESDGEVVDDENVGTETSTNGIKPTDNSDSDTATNADQLRELIQTKSDCIIDPYIVDSVMPDDFFYCSEDDSIGRLKIFNLPIETSRQSAEERSSSKETKTETQRVFVHEHIH